MRNLWGVLVSLAYVGAVLGLATLLQKRGRIGEEGARKLVHIALTGWWFIAMVYFSSPLWAALPPAVFTVVNALAYRRGALAAIQRQGPRNTPGTVYYAVSLLVLALFSFGSGARYIGALGAVCMGLGDGLAAIAGARRGAGAGKSAAGSLAMFGASAFACLFVLLIFAPITAPAALWQALVIAALATGFEYISPGGLDNLSVPLGAAGAYWVLFYAGATHTSLAAGALLSGAVALLALRARLLTGLAALGALAAGCALYTLGGWGLWALLIWFFCSSNLAARVLAKRGGAQRTKGERRDVRQVLANSAPALVCAGCYALGVGPWSLVAAAAALAAATADTWASEVGIFSKQPPVDILTGAPVQRGISGGVSALGFAASCVAALATALLAMLLFRLQAPTLPTSPAALLLVAAGGIAGSVIDSLLGSALQAKYQCAASGILVESPADGATTLVAGRAWATNNMVNLLSGCLVAALALTIGLFL